MLEINHRSIGEQLVPKIQEWLLGHAMVREHQPADVARHSCTERLRSSNTRGKHLVAGDELLEACHREYRRSYLAKRLRFALPEFRPMAPRQSGTVVFDLLGTLDGIPIDVIGVPGDWGEVSSSIHARLLKQQSHLLRAAVATGYKLTGKAEMIIGVFNYGGDAVHWFTTSNPTGVRAVASEILQDCSYLSRVTLEGSSVYKVASPSDCSVCGLGCKPDSSPSKLTPIVSLGLIHHPMDRTLEKILWDANDEKSVRRTGVISPSDISTNPCSRALVYKVLEIPREEEIRPQTRTVFDRGHAAHSVLQRALEDLLPYFVSEARAYSPDLNIDGNADGVLLPLVFEIKTISQLQFAKLRSPKAEHIEQATIYASILKAEMIVFLYMCKGTGALKIFLSPPSRKAWNETALRAHMVMQHVKKGTLPLQLEVDSACAQCAYLWHCKPDKYQSKRPQGAEVRF